MKIFLCRWYFRGRSNPDETTVRQKIVHANSIEDAYDKTPPINISGDWVFLNWFIEEIQDAPSAAPQTV